MLNCHILANNNGSALPGPDYTVPYCINNWHISLLMQSSVQLFFSVVIMNCHFSSFSFPTELSIQLPGGGFVLENQGSVNACVQLTGSMTADNITVVVSSVDSSAKGIVA